MQDGTNTNNNKHYEQSPKIRTVCSLLIGSVVLLLIFLSIASGGEQTTRLARAFGVESRERIINFELEGTGIEPIPRVETGAIVFGESTPDAGATEGSGGQDNQPIIPGNTGKVEKVPNAGVWQKRDVGADVNAIIAHASRVSGNDLDFIATLDKENAGSWDTHIKNYNRNGTWDIGLCQYNSQYFMHIINDPQFSNPEWQVNRCLELYRGWEARGILHKRFYAYPKRKSSKKNFYMSE